jgi:phosphoglycerate dehydrogenase-like enzyme
VIPIVHERLSEAALVQALLAGKVAGAAMDVSEVEPLPLAWERVHRNTVDNLFRHLGTT